MLTLQEAMASGRAFKRSSMSGYYTSFAAMAAQEDIETSSEELEALRATDYVLESDTIEGIDTDILAVAWNASLPRGGSVARAEASRFFTQFKAKLIALAAQNAG